jgi:hypothetical protein
MSNVTIEVSPLKVAVIAAGVIALALGALTFHIADVVKTTMWLSGVENFLYSFLTFGSRPIWLADIRNFAYFWFGFGAILILLPLFVKVPTEQEATERQTAAQKPETEQAREVREFYNRNIGEMADSAKSKLTLEKHRALTDDVFKDIGDKVKSVFASILTCISALKSVKPVASEKSVRVEPVLKSKE